MALTHHIPIVPGGPAISLHQPWATALVAGVKKFETRTWALPAHLVGEPIAIHATKRQPDRGLVAKLPPSLRAGIPTGAIVGSVVFNGSHLVTGDPEQRIDHLRVTDHYYQVVPVRQDRSTYEWEVWLDDVWSDMGLGRHVWTVGRAKRLDSPLPTTGRQGIWYWHPAQHMPARWIRAYRPLVALARQTVANEARWGAGSGRSLMPGLRWKSDVPKGECPWCRGRSPRARKAWHDECLVAYLLARGQTIDLNRRSLTPYAPCAGCGADDPTEIDHRVPLSVARATGDPRIMARAWSLRNLQWLCRKCHAEKTGRDRRLLGRIRREKGSAGDLFSEGPARWGALWARANSQFDT